MTFPLDGIPVLDLSQAISGPHAGRVLADLGADVVIENFPPPVLDCAGLGYEAVLAHWLGLAPGDVAAAGHAGGLG